MPVKVILNLKKSLWSLFMGFNCLKTTATWRSFFFRAQKNIQDVLAFLAHIKISKSVFI